MNILILGGNRFTGKLITEKLYTGGHSVTLINRKGSAPVPCEVIKCDRNDYEQMSLAIGDRSFDCIIDMCLFNKKQAEISIKLFNNKIKKYIFISSVAVYKKSEFFPITENAPLGAWPLFGDYGNEKMEIENYFESLKDFPFICLRPTYIIGKNNHLNRENYYFDTLLNNQKINIEDDGQAIVSFVFVEDAAEIIYQLTLSNAKLRQAYNVCNDEFVTIKGFIETIASIVKRKPNYNQVNEIVSFKNEHCFFSNEKIKKELNFKFKSLKKGLTELYEYNLQTNNT